MMRVLVTGASGLIGTHVRALLYAKNGEAKFNSDTEPFEIRLATRTEFSETNLLSEVVTDVDLVVHCAGVNRGTAEEVANGNQEIAQVLVDCLRENEQAPTIVYLNSTHSETDSSYGQGKRQTAEIFQNWCNESQCCFIDLILPHIFGEGGKPFYNSVTATLCRQIVDRIEPELNSDGKVELLHAGVVAERALDYGQSGVGGQYRVQGTPLEVTSLYSRLSELFDSYCNGLMPGLSSALEVQLFNTLRTNLYPSYYPAILATHSDDRGVLFEAVKGGAGQTFLSWTKSGVTRGNHFHRNKVERFLVVKGTGLIRIRHIFTDVVQEFLVDGDKPGYVDIPTLHTHSIKNVGKEPMLTLFWANEVFDPNKSDTYLDPVDSHSP